MIATNSFLYIDFYDKFALSMIVNLAKNLLHINLLYRGLALLFLALIFTDIFMPDLCCAEINEIVSAESNYAYLHSSDHNTIPAINTSHHSDQDEHGKCDAADEGCFCCCAHFIVSKTLFIAIPLSEEILFYSKQKSLPIAPRSSMFHPPRTV